MKSSTLVTIEGCFASPNTSAPNLKTLVATYWLAPFTRLTTAITAATPMTTPISVSTLRSLCAHRLPTAIDIASPNAILEVCTNRGPYLTYALQPQEKRLRKTIPPKGTGTSPNREVRNDPKKLCKGI